MHEKKLHKDQMYIDGLLNNNSFIIKSIYEKFAPKVINYIKNNSGDYDSAQDIIQESIITIYNQASQNNLKLTCPFDAYFFLVCKRKWLNEIKKNFSAKQVTIYDVSLSKDKEEQLLADETLLFEERQTIFDKMFQKLGDKCKDLLKISFKIKSMEKVAEALGVTYSYARKKKSICIKQLTNLVKDSSNYNQLNQK